MIPISMPRSISTILKVNTTSVKKNGPHLLNFDHKIGESFSRSRVQSNQPSHIAHCQSESKRLHQLSIEEPSVRDSLGTEMAVEEHAAEKTNETQKRPDDVIAQSRSAPTDSKTLAKNLLPWQLAFDRFMVDPVLPPLLNDAVQPTWFESVQDPGRAGPYRVNSYFIDLKPESTGRTLNAQVMAPSSAQKSGPSPVVLISPPCFVGELKLPFDQRFYDVQPYQGFMRQFASMGYVAVGLFEHRGIVFEPQDFVDHERDAFELRSITDQLLGDNSPIKEKIRTDDIAVMGHSKGGKMAFYHAAIDPRVKLVLAIDPVNMGGPPWFVSKKFADNPVAPTPGITQEGAPSLMEKVTAKSVIFRAPPDFVNFDRRFNAEHFWNAFAGDGVYIDCKASHGDWLLRKDLREVTRRVFTAALMDVFHEKKPFANELRACEIKGNTPNLVKGVEIKTKESVTPSEDKV